MKYQFPTYKTKAEFTPGTFSENEWQLGESVCVERYYYSLPNGSEYAVFKFCERTRSGGKKTRWEVWHNGKFSNNYFNGFDEAIQNVNGEINFNGFTGDYRTYRTRP